MKRLHSAAKSFLEQSHRIVGGKWWHPFECLVRCKPHDYFKQVCNEQGGVMQPYLKDASRGHAASAINGRLKCLSFSIPTHEPESSPFGEIKFEITAHQLLISKEHRTYFADFYCNRRLGSGSSEGSEEGSYQLPAHHITLVVCRHESDSDR